MTDFQDAQDIAEGTPLSGPDRLVGRIQDAMYEACDKGYDEGLEAGRSEGYASALDDLARELGLDSLEVQQRDKTDSPEDAFEWVRVALEKREELATIEAFNSGVEVAVERLDPEGHKSTSGLWKE